MNRYETWFCGTRLCGGDRGASLPWILQGSQLVSMCWNWCRARRGDRGVAALAARVTSLEYDHAFAAKLGARVNGSNDEASGWQSRKKKSCPQTARSPHRPDHCAFEPFTRAPSFAANAWSYSRLVTRAARRRNSSVAGLARHRVPAHAHPVANPCKIQGKTWRRVTHRHSRVPQNHVSYRFIEISTEIRRQAILS